MSKTFLPIKALTLLWEKGIPICPISNKPFIDKDKAWANTERFLKDNDLLNRWKSGDAEQNEFVIAETSFGISLNFIASWFYWLQYTPATARLHYISCENRPLNKHDLNLILAMWPQFTREAGQLLAEYPILTPGIHQLILEDGRVSLTFMLGEPSACFRQLLHCGDAALEKTIRSSFVDAWIINNEKVTDELLTSIAMLSKAETTFTGMKIAANTNHKNRNTPWHCKRAEPVNSRHAIVIGAGLAGCLTAHALARRGWEILLIDAAGEVGTGASGNASAVLYPKLSPFDSPLTAFMLDSYLYASRFYSKILETCSIGELSGVLQLACNPREISLQMALSKWLDAYPELGKLVTAKEASTLSGITLEQGGLYLPHSGWLDCKAICDYLIQYPGIHLLTNHTVESLDYNHGLWSVDGTFQSSHVVIASGYQAIKFEQTSHFPLRPVAGLLSKIRSNRHSESLKIPICGEGHIVPARGGIHLLGATYHMDSNFINDRDDADQDNLNKLSKLDRKGVFSQELIGNWSGTRGTVPDYLPLVGPVPDLNAFEKTFELLASDAKRWVPCAGDYYPGLYLCAGFGSRGLTTAPLSAEWLASIMNGELSFLPDRLTRSLSPSRVLIKKMIKNKGKTHF